MKINDRVRYDEENAALPDIAGTVVLPTETEVADCRDSAVPATAVMVEWDDGERFWEDPGSLVEVNE